MGYAAYRRGSKAISDGIARDAYRDGLSWYNPDAPAPKPKPRPSDWGDKTAARAAGVVARHLRAVRLIAECREQPFTWTQQDEDMAVDNLSERYRIGKSTLRAAFANLKGTT